MSAVIHYDPTSTTSSAQPIPQQPITPLAMLDAAVARGADIAIIEKMMGLHERWEAGQARKAFDNAIAEAKSEIGPVVKNATGHNNKKYADFAAISRAVDPILSKNGLSYRFRTAQTDTRIAVTCILSHRDGHSEETTLSGPADASGSKNAIQAIGSTLTYLQRYSLTQALGLAASEDDDGRSIGSKDSGEVLSAEQVETIRKALEYRGKTEAGLLKVIRVASLDDVLASKFNEVLAMINRGAR